MSQSVLKTKQSLSTSLQNTLQGRTSEEIVEALDKCNIEDLQQMEEILRPEVRVTWDARFCIENYFWIKDKNKNLVKLVFNKAQNDYLSGRTNRNVIMKPRQLGFSTLILALDFYDTIINPYVTSVVVSHDFDATERLFRIVSRFNDHLPSFMKRKTDVKNKREFSFGDIDSNFFVNTSVKISSGRGDTINNLHASEVAFWRNAEEVMPALLEAVPMKGYAEMECSPEGRINRYFQEFWVESKTGANGFKHFFYPWWFTSEYQLPLDPDEEVVMDKEDRRMMETNELTLEQMKFYLRKRAVLKGNVHREYPSDDVRPFLFAGECFFDTEVILAIMRSNVFTPPRIENGVKIYKAPDPIKRYVIGGDSAKGIGRGTSKCAAEVIEVESCEQVAEFIERVTPTQFGRVLDKLGRMYNNALIGVESNHPGPATLVTLMEECHYPNMYWYVDYARRPSHSKNQIDAAGQPGYPTNEKTRPTYLLHLQEMLESELLVINSIEFLNACAEFKLDVTGRPAGAGDDPVIAMGIALQLRRSANTSFMELLNGMKSGDKGSVYASMEQSTTTQIFNESRESLTQLRRDRSRFAPER